MKIILKLQDYFEDYFERLFWKFFKQCKIHTNMTYTSICQNITLYTEKNLLLQIILLLFLKYGLKNP